MALAIDGQQAVDLGPGMKPDLILMDLGLPVIGGGKLYENEADAETVTFRTA